jgi:lipopolysaccharide export system protein LptA
MGKLLKYVLSILIILLSTATLKSQKVDKISYDAGVLEFGKRQGERVRILTENVVFKQESTTIYCDSSYFYKRRNEMEAFGHVKIVDDSTIITSQKLIYNGDERNAKLREDVVYVRGENKLYTDFLDYDFNTEIAYYFNNGRLVDTANILTSGKAEFHANKDYALFQKDVVLTTKDFILKTDTLKYNTETKIAYTYGPTEIITDDGSKLISKGGEFKTVTDESAFVDGYIETTDYFLKGDRLYFDEQNKYYKAEGNVSLTAKSKDVIIIGNEGFYDKQSGLSKIYGLPLMKKIMQNDTLYLSADTLTAVESEYDSIKRILAYYYVKIYKIGLQGIADSMAYFQTDSLIRFYKNPIMWNKKSQIIADTINMEIRNQTIDNMKLRKNAFIISKDTISNFNQIKGRNMMAVFKDNKISNIDVVGNGEMLFYGLEDNDTRVLGMNKIFCSSMKIAFDSLQRLSYFRVYVSPEAQFIPPHELTPDIQRLAGFNWSIEKRPKLFDVAYYLNPDLNYDSLLLADSVSTPRINQQEEIDYNNNENSVTSNKSNQDTKGKTGGRNNDVNNNFGRNANNSNSTNTSGSTTVPNAVTRPSNPRATKTLIRSVDDQ